MCTKRKRDDWQDDGRVIANMYVDGMPDTLSRGNTRRRFDEFGRVRAKPDPVELTRGEKRAIRRGAGLAIVLTAVVAITVFGLFLWFCTAVWFK